MRVWSGSLGLENLESPFPSPLKRAGYEGEEEGDESFRFFPPPSPFPLLLLLLSHSPNVLFLPSPIRFPDASPANPRMRVGSEQPQNKTPILSFFSSLGGGGGGEGEGRGEGRGEEMSASTGGDRERGHNSVVTPNSDRKVLVF